MPTEIAARRQQQEQQASVDQRQEQEVTSDPVHPGVFEISKTNKLISMDMVEINPLIVENSVEDANKTADIANYLIRTIMK